MSDEQAPDAPDPARDGALRALAENPTVRPSIRVAARMALRKARQQASAGPGRRGRKTDRKPG